MNVYFFSNYFLNFDLCVLAVLKDSGGDHGADGGKVKINKIV